MKFINYPSKFNNEPKNGTVYSDVGNHCNRWSYYKDPKSVTTSAHEGTHGINADLRNQRISWLYSGSGKLGLPQPAEFLVGSSVGAGMNAFYLL
ncbi:MAG TPA: hypothetical protein VM260_05315, partial [Pirellula sp.]|nr:hypothetical protein [Pirellula sp.]